MGSEPAVVPTADSPTESLGALIPVPCAHRVGPRLSNHRRALRVDCRAFSPGDLLNFGPRGGTASPDRNHWTLAIREIPVNFGSDEQMKSMAASMMSRGSSAESVRDRLNNVRPQDSSLPAVQLRTKRLVTGDCTKPPRGVKSFSCKASIWITRQFETDRAAPNVLCFMTVASGLGGCLNEQP